MLAAFPQQLAPCGLAHGFETIQLLVQMLGSNPHPWFHPFGQPLGTMTAAIDAGARTGNGPTSVHRPLGSRPSSRKTGPESLSSYLLSPAPQELSERAWRSDSAAQPRGHNG